MFDGLALETPQPAPPPPYEPPAPEEPEDDEAEAEEDEEEDDGQVAAMNVGAVQPEVLIPGLTPPKPAFEETIEKLSVRVDGLFRMLQVQQEKLDAVVKENQSLKEELAEVKKTHGAVTVKNLAKAAGYTCTEARAAGFTCAAVAAAGYTCAEVRIAGFSCADAVQHYLRGDVKSAGFALHEIEAVEAEERRLADVKRQEEAAAAEARRQARNEALIAEQAAAQAAAQVPKYPLKSRVLVKRSSGLDCECIVDKIERDPTNSVFMYTLDLQDGHVKTVPEHIVRPFGSTDPTPVRSPEMASNSMNASYMPPVLAGQQTPAGSKPCHNCNAVLAPGARFCKECGTPWKEPAPPTPISSAPVSSNKCFKCTSPMLPTAMFCVHCGTPRNNPVAPPQSTAQPLACKKCTAPLGRSMKFCNNCGTPAN